MKLKILLPALFGIAFSFALKAQIPKEFVIKKGEVAVNVIPYEEQYRFPQFQEGKVTFFNNEVVHASMNYNHLYGEIHFLNDKGDTLSIGNGPKIRHVEMGENRFWMAVKDGIMEEKWAYPEVKLAKKQELVLISGNIFPFEQSHISTGDPAIHGSGPSGDATGDFYSKTMEYKDVYTRPATDKMVISEQISYFFIDRHNHFYPAKSGSIYKIFSRNKDAVKKYVDDYKIDFKKEEDLKMLLEFCSRQGASMLNTLSVSQTAKPVEDLSYFMADEKPERGKAKQELEVGVKISFPSVPDFIVFRNILQLSGGEAVNLQAEQAQKKMLAYLDKKGIFYEKDSRGILELKEGEEVAWQYFKIKLSYRQYLYFKQEFSAKNDVKILPDKIYYKEKDRKKLNRMVLEQAEFKAGLAAGEKGLSVGKLTRIEEINEEGDWQIFPPATADVNYFDSRLEGEYKVSFEVLPL